MKTVQSLGNIKQSVAHDLKAVDTLLFTSLHSDVPLVKEVSQHLLKSGGKRLRALLVLLVARTLSYEGTAHHTLAAVIELIHAATLLHDDVVDISLLRRGQATANAVFGNSASILVGDFLYSRSFQMMVQLERLDIMQLLSDTTNTIAEGEVLQLSQLQNARLSEPEYFAIIERKTATLFEAAAGLGALLGATATLLRPLKTFGKHFGICYQLIDDALDYSGDETLLGKRVGDDLKEGKMTLPLIHALQSLPTQKSAQLVEAILAKDESAFSLATEAIASSNAIAYTLKQAKTQATLAKEALPMTAMQSPYKEAILALLDYVVERES